MAIRDVLTSQSFTIFIEIKRKVLTREMRNAFWMQCKNYIFHLVISSVLESIIDFIT